MGAREELLPPDRPFGHLSDEELDLELLRAEFLLARNRKQQDFIDFCRDQELFPGYPPAQHHQAICSLLQQVAEGQMKRLMLFAPPGAAKALALDTPIPTPSGWRNMGELRVGDSVFGDDGRPCTVTWVSPVWRNRPVYAVTTDCGDTIIADHDHEWLVRLCGKRRPSHWKKRTIVETHELAKRRAKRPMIDRAGALELPDADLPIDPYLLGVWLGDGHSREPCITAADEDRAFYEAHCATLGIETRPTNARLTFRLVGMRARFVSLGLLHDPTHQTVGRKHIPPAYLRASKRQRMALLQGLIDTDGTVCKKRGSSTFCNTNKELCEQVRELVRSLGVKAGWSESRAVLNGKDCGSVYRVSFYLAWSARLPRKAMLTRNQKRTPNAYVDVREAGWADTVCIEVDSPTHLFLCGKSMLPTHNSWYASVRFPAWLVGKYPGIKLIAASHTYKLAKRHARMVRGLVSSPFYRENVWPEVELGDSQDQGDWSTTDGSELFASGFDGAIAGRRADGILIDDPIKSKLEALSETIRENIWQVYKDLRDRLRKDGWIVIIMTRWHMDDLCGRILPADWDGRSGVVTARDGEDWFVANLQMVNEFEDDLLGRPAVSIPGLGSDPIGASEAARALLEKQPKALLWQEWFDLERVVQDIRSQGVDFQPKFQGRPTGKEGNILLRRYWQKWPDLKTSPVCDFILQVYDTAFEEDEEADYSARITLGIFDVHQQDNAKLLTQILKERKIVQRYHAILLESWHGKVDFNALKRNAKDSFKEWEPDRILVEKKASGHSLLQELRRIPLPVRPVKADTSKFARANAAQAVFAELCIWYVPNASNLAVIDECANFPNGSNDDWVDCVTHGVYYLRRRWHLQLPEEKEDETDGDKLRQRDVRPIY